MHHILDTQSTANSFIIHRNCSAMNQTMEFLHFKLVSKQLKRLVQKVLELCTATEYPRLKSCQEFLKIYKDTMEQNYLFVRIYVVQRFSKIINDYLWNQDTSLYRWLRLTTFQDINFTVQQI